MSRSNCIFSLNGVDCMLYTRYIQGWGVNHTHSLTNRVARLVPNLTFRSLSSPQFTQEKTQPLLTARRKLHLLDSFLWANCPAGYFRQRVTDASSLFFQWCVLGPGKDVQTVNCILFFPLSPLCRKCNRIECGDTVYHVSSSPPEVTEGHASVDGKKEMDRMKLEDGEAKREKRQGHTRRKYMYSDRISFFYFQDKESMWSVEMNLEDEKPLMRSSQRLVTHMAHI